MADDFWGGLDIPSTGGSGYVNQNSALGATPDLADLDIRLVKRAMVVFFVVDVSGSMRGARIGAVNDAIRNLLPELKKKEATNTSAQIKIAILEFSGRAQWKTPSPQPVSDFIFHDIEVSQSGGTNYGAAFEQLNEKMSSKEFLNSASGSYTPLVIFLTDGKPSDIGLYPEQLEKLRHNTWFNYATKVAIAIEKDAADPACRKALIAFTGNEKMVLEAKDTNILAKQIELVTATGINTVTKQGSMQNSGAAVNTGVKAANAAQNPVPAVSPAPKADPAVDPSIPGLSDIDWTKSFPTF